MIVDSSGSLYELTPDGPVLVALSTPGEPVFAVSPVAAPASSPPAVGRLAAAGRLQRAWSSRTTRAEGVRGDRRWVRAAGVGRGGRARRRDRGRSLRRLLPGSVRRASLSLALDHDHLRSRDDRLHRATRWRGSSSSTRLARAAMRWDRPRPRPRVHPGRRPGRGGTPEVIRAELLPEPPPEPTTMVVELEQVDSTESVLVIDRGGSLMEARSANPVPAIPELIGVQIVRADDGGTIVVWDGSMCDRDLWVSIEADDPGPPDRIVVHGTRTGTCRLALVRRAIWLDLGPVDVASIGARWSVGPPDERPARRRARSSASRRPSWSGRTPADDHQLAGARMVLARSCGLRLLRPADVHRPRSSRAARGRTTGSWPIRRTSPELGSRSGCGPGSIPRCSGSTTRARWSSLVTSLTPSRRPVRPRRGSRAGTFS